MFCLSVARVSVRDSAGLDWVEQYVAMLIFFLNMQKSVGLVFS